MAKETTKLQPDGLNNLRAYQLAKQLGHLIYEVTTDFPKSEFRLIGQMRGATVSVFGNIAEGYGRNMLGDYIRFCEIARGSLFELGSYIEFCQERKMFQNNETELIQLYKHTRNTLGALLHSLNQKKQRDNFDRSYTSLKENSAFYDFQPPTLPIPQSPDISPENTQDAL